MKKIVKLIALLCALTLLLAACGAKAPAATEAPATEVPVTEIPATEITATEIPATEAPATEAANGLAIPLADLSTQPLFIDWNQDGTAMQLIALIDDAGAPQLAYNTCQVCAGSPYAYFEYQNGVLVCQNCGNRFALSAVGKVSGGCNPMPVTNYENDGAQLVVPEDVLAQAAPSFKNWKAF